MPSFRTTVLFWAPSLNGVYDNTIYTGQQGHSAANERWCVIGLPMCRLVPFFVDQSRKRGNDNILFFSVACEYDVLLLVGDNMKTRTRPFANLEEVEIPYDLIVGALFLMARTCLVSMGAFLLPAQERQIVEAMTTQ